MARAFAEIAFTPAVRAQQEKLGSAKAYAQFLDDDETGGDRLGPAETAFVQERDGFYQASVSETGWPYVQFRGGPKGFLKVLDEKTVAYADFRGNRQYVSVGNLTQNDRVSLILMDYPSRARMKIWGRVSFLDAEAAPDIADMVRLPGYKARIERIAVIRIEAFDWNCPQHIPIRLTLDELDTHLCPVRDHIARLTAENTALKEALARAGAPPVTEVSDEETTAAPSDTANS